MGTKIFNLHSELKNIHTTANIFVITTSTNPKANCMNHEEIRVVLLGTLILLIPPDHLAQNTFGSQAIVM